LAGGLVCLKPPQALVSFTFDDFPVSALVTGGEILQQHGLAGTYYASLGLMGTDTPTGRIFAAGDLEKLVAQGHELGCHTYAHCHAWETPPARFEQSLIENQRALDRLLPGTVFRTLSYPISCARPQTKRLAQKYFAGCRGAGQSFNVGSTDLNYLNAFFLEQSRDDFGAIQRVIDDNVLAGGWLIFATHDICRHPTSFGVTPALFSQVVRYAVQSGATILPVFPGLPIGHGNNGEPLASNKDSQS
jgi:peptidoglycan/xylan/chitin deacetylase (PgdA/CDA1 family)